MKIGFNNFMMAVICLAFSSSILFAQRGTVTQYASPLSPAAKSTPLYLGPAAGVNILGHTMDIPTFVDDNLCPVFKDAAGIGFFGGLTMEYLLGKDKANSTSSIIVRALYNMYPGSVTVGDNKYPVRMPDGSVFNESEVENVMDIDYNALTLEVMYKINPFPSMGFGIVVGPAFDFILTKNRTHKFNIIAPNNAQFITDDGRFPEGTTFENYDQTAVMYDGEIADASSIRFGLKAGVQYEILLNSKFYIVPSVSYNFGVTNVTSQYSWRVSPLQIGLDARYAF
jgi:hypothetical protein